MSLRPVGQISTILTCPQGRPRSSRRGGLQGQNDLLKETSQEQMFFGLCVFFSGYLV